MLKSQQRFIRAGPRSFLMQDIPDQGSNLLTIKAIK